ncbi:MAG: T9SS type A sorting domain-containing protein [Bacteroidota bacterium]
MESNSKLVNQIYYSYAEDTLHQLDSLTRALANSIAYQNVIEGGLDIYTVRAILNIDVIDDPVGYYRKANPETQNSNLEFNGRMYPNPTSDFITYAYCLDSESGLLEITDVLGKLLMTFPLKADEKLITINTMKLEAGVYLYKAIGISGVKQQGKFSIIK